METSQTLPVAPESPRVNGTGPGGRRCSQCGTPLPLVAHFCPTCGLVAGPDPKEANDDAVSSRGSGGRVPKVALAIAMLGAAAVAVLIVAGNAGQNGAASATSSPAAGVARVTSRTPSPTPTDTATTGPSPSPRATITPTPILPTPIIAGVPTLAVPASSPAREIVDTVNRSAAAYSAAMSRLDESLLEPVFTGEALAYYTAKIHDLRAFGGTSTPSLTEIQLVSVQPGASEARVTTRERWKTRSSASICTAEGYEVAYTLVRQDALWLVTAAAFQQASLEPC